MAKRYYWLKLKEDFFDKKLIKKLSSTYTTYQVEDKIILETFN